MFYAATQSGGSSFTPFLLIVAFVVVIYFVLLRPNRRRQQAARQAHQDMLNNLGEGTKIVTIGGLHGTIVGSDADSVTLEISPGVHARFDRAAIAKVVPDDVDDTMLPDAVTYDDGDATKTPTCVRRHCCGLSCASSLLRRRRCCRRLRR